MTDTRKTIAESSDANKQQIVDVVTASSEWAALASQSATLFKISIKDASLGPPAVGGGADCTDAIIARLPYLNAHPGAVLWFPFDTYGIRPGEIIVDGNWFAIEGDGAVFVNLDASKKITTATAPDLTYPTATVPGPLGGCAFYFTTVIYFSRIVGITFRGFRFACSFYVTHNGPVFKRVIFDNCNAGVIAYQGAQNFQFLGSAAPSSGTMFIGGATCFPADHPLASQDNYYCDGTRVENGDDYIPTGNMYEYSHFDDWFVASILRPSTPSVTIIQSITYNDADGVVYPPSSKYCRPSSRLIFIPMRNSRSVYGAYFNQVDVRGICYRGIALINSRVIDLNIGPLIFEALFLPTPLDTQQPLFEIGGVTNGVIRGWTAPYAGEPSTSSHRAIGWTRRLCNFSEGNGSYMAYMGVDPQVTVNNQYLGFVKGDLHRTSERIFNLDNQFCTYDGRSHGPIVKYSDFTVGSVYTDNSLHTLREGVPDVITLPQHNGTKWYSDILFNLTYPISGFLTILVLNMTKGEWDTGVFHIETGGVAGSLITAADLTNGDAYIAVTSDPPNTARYARFQIDTGVYVAQDYYDSVNKRIYVVGGHVTGLTSFLPAGSSIAYAHRFTTVKAFSQGWLTAGFGLVPFSGAAQLTLKNNTMTDDDGVTKDALKIFLRLSALPDPGYV